MTEDIMIRPATDDDLQDIARIHVISWQQTYIGQIPQDYLDSLNIDDRRKKWEELFQGKTAEDQHLYLAHQNGKAVGFISFGRGRDSSQSNFGEIYAVYLLQEALGKGIGYALFDTAIQALGKAGYTKLYTLVLDTNQVAIRSYLRWGGTLDQTLIKNDSIGEKPIKEVAVIFNLRQHIANTPVFTTKPVP